MKLRWKVLVLVGVGLGAAWVLLGRLPYVPVPAPHDWRPAPTYAAAVARIDSIRAHEGPEINPECHTRLLGPGIRTSNVLVIFHGFTNCPKQFDPMARDFVRLGYNVYIPRLPRHGMADRMTEELRHLTAEEMVRAGEDAVDIAAGLGDHVTVTGLSSGAVLAGWVAQQRPEVDGAVMIAPAFAPRPVPAPAARQVAGALLKLPNFFVWWDSKQGARLGGPKQCYPRFASHALAEVYRLGFSVIEGTERLGLDPGVTVLITAEGDEGVNNAMTADLARTLRSHGSNVRTYEFPESLHVRHDMIDKDQAYQRVSVTYPAIESLVVRCGR